MNPIALGELGTLTILSPALQQDLLRQARAEAPREACGLLLGLVSGTHIEVLELVTTQNLARGTDSFEIDPGEVVRADIDARRRGLELVGIWHSHPLDEAVPSASDVRAIWPGHVCVIVSLCAQQSVRAWRVLEDGVVEIMSRMSAA